MKLDVIELVRKNKEKIIKLFEILFRILVCLFIILLLLFIYINEMKSIKTFNYEAFIIVSESMKPEIKVGDIVIIKKTPEDSIKREDIITFEKDNEYITHRVKTIEIQNGEKLYITKGDNNQVNDLEQVDYSQIKGVKVAQIHYIGLLMIKIFEQRNIIIIVIIFMLLYKKALKNDNKKKERIIKKRIEDEKNFKDK